MRGTWPSSVETDREVLGVRVLSAAVDVWNRLRNVKTKATFLMLSVFHIALAPVPGPSLAGVTACWAASQELRVLWGPLARPFLLFPYFLWARRYEG